MVHDLHVNSLISRKVPTAHGMHIACAPSGINPTSHAAHASDPGPATRPVGHVTQLYFLDAIVTFVDAPTGLPEPEHSIMETST